MTTHLMTTWRVCYSPLIVTSVSETAGVLERDRWCGASVSETGGVLERDRWCGAPTSRTMTTHLMTTWRVSCSPLIVTSVSETAGVLERDRWCGAPTSRTMTTHLMTTWRVCCSPLIVTSSETGAVLERDRWCVRARQVVWCPYIPDDDDAPDDDVARLLLTTHCNIARMWNISSIVKCISSTECRGDASSLLASAGALATSEHSAPIVDAAFSPDGTALATASHDGYVMFFQVYMMGEGSPRCLHKWQPHGGKPLSCLFFLDNHKNYNSDVQFWKFAVTGADQNTVIKIWSCKSWTCLQTINFTPTLGPEPSPPGLKAMLDTSASYLLLSDFKARSLYVLNMARDKDDTMAYCKSISEYMLPYPVLSFCIIDAEEDTTPEVCESPFLRNGSSASAEPLEEIRGIRLRLYIVQPKGLQEGELLFVPPQSDMLNSNNSQNISFPDLSDLALEDKNTSVSANMASGILQQQSQQLKNLLMRAQTQPGTLIQRDEQHQLNLMTPDAFSSPGKREEDDPPLAATPEIPPRAMVCDDNKLTSGGSSPSREVQQIMAHNSALYKGGEDDDEPNEEEESTQTPVAEDEEVETEVIQNGTEPIYPTVVTDIFVSPEKPPAKLTHSNSDTSWPQISIAQINEANQRKASSDKSSSQSLNNSLNISAVERAGSEEPRVVVGGLSPADKNRLENLEQKLDKLCDLVMQQSRELRSLRGEMLSPREMIDSALHAHAQRTTQAIESALADGWERISRVGETAASRAAQAAGVGAARALEPLAAALQHELAAKLTATDHLLRDNIEKLANSKTVMERLSASIASSLSDMVRESFRGALLQSVVPVMEKAHAQIFRQVNHAFQTGTKEFAANTEAAARAAAERGGAAASTQLKLALERHTEALNAAVPPQAVLAQTLKDVAHSVLEKELLWWREQARAAAVQMSRAHSPATPAASHTSAVDRQMQVAQIQSLMSAGDVNGAFQLALSASDLALVVQACRSADPAVVFGPPCKLKQHVLLSLVQQLAADITRDTNLCHRYLEEAIMNLDTSNPVTREHLPVVVRELQKQIMAFLTAHPNHALHRQFKMLLMAADSLVKTV
ncbi:WD40 region of ge1, enhancer of mRNA-decapping protein domain-containing protein [Phthorimaea operculella]|nr:WD40 region of ge1, enhancer of mRNA-decapping protein domain-containing protein [Phthorimaea operculella]